MSEIKPNTTQIPHVIIREWMPRLSDTELRILLVVADQTLGWIEDEKTGRRKEKDWISHFQLRTRIRKRGIGKDGKPKVSGERSVSKALASLVDQLRIIEALDGQGNLLDSPQKRMKNGGKIFYRLSLRPPERSLFDTPAKSAGAVESLGKSEQPPQKVRAQKVRATKETSFTKINTMQPENPAAPEDKKETKKERSAHMRFMDFWVNTVRRTRRMDPIITGKDGRNLKRVLDAGVDEQLLEQIALYFLADYSFRTFSPSISTLCSAGIINGLINRSQNDPNFRKNLDQYVDQYLPRPAVARTYGMTDLQSAMKTLLVKFEMPGRDLEKVQI